MCIKSGKTCSPDKVIHIIHMFINIICCIDMWIFSWIMHLHNILRISIENREFCLISCQIPSNSVSHNKIFPPGYPHYPHSAAFRLSMYDNIYRLFSFF